VLVLPDARQFVELTDNGVLVRGYLEESVLRLARPKTIGGVWTRRGDSVRVKSINGETVRAVLEAPAPNVEVVGAPETIDLACADLHVGREPFSLPSPGASKRTAFVRPKTTLEMSESEQSAITIRFHVADPGFAIDVLEERAGRARITFDAQTIGRFTGWVAARSLAKVPKADSSSKAEQIRRELEKLNPPSIAAVVAAPPGSSLATADRGRASIATCDLRLLADVDGTLTVIGSVAHGTPLRIGGAETTLLQVSFDGVDIDGGSSVPARDDVACKAATTPFRLFEAPRTPTLAPATVAAKNAWDIGQIDPAEGRRRLLDVVKRGAATPDEVAVLGSLCTSLRDEACIATCKEHGWPQ